MPIRFHPRPGRFLTCDYRGYEAPEMIKRRPVVVISPRKRQGPGLCTVVPLSTTPPNLQTACHVKIEIDPLGGRWTATEMWAKCDMITVASFSRLDMIRTGKALDGKRIYNNNELDADLLKKIREACAFSFGL
ncbi:type II toxin-antitoxin system PemK/MazF family toxin [Thalassospira sp. B30-1]|jgi:mRNA interferase MazF|uniref:type II toxin-antitoxin system PemK/MazF family toxin n=1 Tax=Thalassospira sp. B30-1 TaxID=2785911 RepID=UPI0018CB9CAA|nr:type II toxin-antitoxin system PemK/MazF family toxin [Thalassospira sp. B30-1]